MQYATPEEAELAFYAAFQHADLTAMMDVWADRDFIECIHPLSGRVRGRSAIKASWQRIFRSGQQLRITCSDIHRTQDSLLAIHVLHEHLEIRGPNERRTAIVATNIYQLVDGSWRMVLHHASPSANSSDTTAENTGGGRQLH